MSISRRIAALEEQSASRQPEASSWAREQMKKHLDRIAHARRSSAGWNEEVEAEVEDVRARLHSRLGRGEPLR